MGWWLAYCTSKTVRCLSCRRLVAEVTAHYFGRAPLCATCQDAAWYEYHDWLVFDAALAEEMSFQAGATDMVSRWYDGSVQERLTPAGVEAEYVDMDDMNLPAPGMLGIIINLLDPPGMLEEMD